MVILRMMAWRSIRYFASFFAFVLSACALVCGIFDEKARLGHRKLIVVPYTLSGFSLPSFYKLQGSASYNTKTPES